MSEVTSSATTRTTFAGFVSLQPQNSQTQIVRCTFNVNISGASGQVLSDAKQELTRIFTSGDNGLNVVFNQNNIFSFQANGGSANLIIVQDYPSEAANAIAKQGGGSASNAKVLGVTPTEGNNSYVNRNYVSSATARLNGASIGTMIGRIGAHELIQHRFLGIGPEGTTPDITSSGISARQLRAGVTTRFDLNPVAAILLRSRCRR